MTPDAPQSSEPLSPRALAGMIVVAAALVFLQMVGLSRSWLLAMMFTEVALAAMVVVAAGGFGHLLVKIIVPSAPPALRALTGCAVGLWILSSAMLAVGTAAKGSLTPWVWWPVIAAGVLLAVVQGFARLRAWRLRPTGGKALVWVLAAVAAALWLGGASRPPGSFGAATTSLQSPAVSTTFDFAGDQYDVLEYHLQVPREYYENRQIGPLRHNCFSFYPMQTEMLFLLAMCLRGGALAGIYLANLMHGIFAVLAGAAVFLACRPDGPRRRFALGLLITCPLLLYLSWLAMVELAEVCYLALALAYLRHWLDATANPQQDLRGGGLGQTPAMGAARIACVIGFLLGAACAVKYLSVGMVALPVAAVMILAAARNVRRLAAIPVVAMAAVLAFSPWLIRNQAYNANPFFPLATTVFGRGPSWGPQEQQRWINGTAGDKQPPVPTPPLWQMPPQPTRAQLFYRNFLASEGFRDITLILAGVYICVMAAAKVHDPWDWSLLAVLSLQLAAWTAFGRQMPPRFLLPAIVPLALLGAGTLERIAGVRTNPFVKSASPPPYGCWGLAPAVAIFLAAVVVNFITAYNVYAAGAAASPQANGTPGERLTIASELDRRHIPLGPGRLMLVGEAQAFFFPPGTVYATVFDPQPLAVMLDRGLDAREVLADLQRRNITHLLINWGAILSQSRGYGFPASLAREVYASGKGIQAELDKCRTLDEYDKAVGPLQDRFPPRMAIADELQALGARRVSLTPQATTAATQQAKASPWAPLLLYIPPDAGKPRRRPSMTP